MSTSESKGKVQTVLGPVAPESLGITMMHEHLLADATCLFRPPKTVREQRFVHQPVNLEILSWLRRNWDSNLDNRRLDDEAMAIKEALQYKFDGGGTIVDVGNVGLGRDPAGLRRISRATGLHVVMGSGYYTAPSHPPGMDHKSEDDFEEEIVRDITIGVADTGVCAGIIGELGCSWPLEENEEKVLKAAAGAQRRTGAPITIHPGRHETAPLKIMQILTEAGANPERVIMGHLDWTSVEIGTLRKLATSGCYLEYDIFGYEHWVFPPDPMLELPSEAQRINRIRELIAEGYVQQILVSQDIAMKMRLASYGGCGYSHILTTVAPMMRRKGVAEEHMQAILVDNPARILQFGDEN